MIAHPPGEEIQFDWLELPDAPPWWGWGPTRICWSARWRIRAGGGRCWRSPRTSRTWSQALDAVVRRLGGDTQGWRFDRMATVCHPCAGRSPRRSPRSRSTTGCRWRSARRGTATARAWWRRPTTRPRNAGGARCPTRDRRSRPSPASTSSPSGWTSRRRDAWTGSKTTVGELAAPSRCRPPGRRRIPAELEVERTVARRRWSRSRATCTRSPPGMPGASVKVAAPARRGHLNRHRRPGGRRPPPPGTATAPGGWSATPDTWSRWNRGAGRVQRPGPVQDQDPPAAPPAALAEAERLRGDSASRRPAERVVIDLAAYAAVGRPAAPTAPTHEEETRRSEHDHRAASMSEARRYQQLRAHLSYLKLERRRRSPAPGPGPGPQPRGCR